jgi:hypothetical protein
VKALYLLHTEAPDRLRALTDEDWRRWATAIISVPMTGDHDKSALVRLSYSSAPEETLAALDPIILKEDADHGHIFIIRELKDAWDGRLTAHLIDLAEHEVFKASSLRSLLEEMLQHDPARTEPYVANLLQTVTVTGDRERLIAVATAAFLYPTPTLWAILWPVVLDDEVFGKEVALAVADGLGATLLKPLSESQMADIYLWLDRLFPRTDDPRFDGMRMHQVGPREQACKMRDRTLMTLAARASTSACDELRRIFVERPDETFLAEIIRGAESRRREATWEPLTAAQLLRLVADPAACTAQTNDQLLEIVVASLRRFAARLHGHHSPVMDLWNEPKEGHKKVYTPKDEDAFSRRVAQHLKDDLGGRKVVVDREVKIREGQFTDVCVEAFSDAGDALTLIIECKGCWHAELLTAMKTQLVDRYLAESHVTHGVYLVGWYFCERWADTDSRKKCCPKDWVAFTSDLAAQASSLSVGGLRIASVVTDTSLRPS